MVICFVIIGGSGEDLWAKLDLISFNPNGPRLSLRTELWVKNAHGSRISKFTPRKTQSVQMRFISYVHVSHLRGVCVRERHDISPHVFSGPNIGGHRHSLQVHVRGQWAVPAFHRCGLRQRAGAILTWILGLGLLSLTTLPWT